LPFVSVQTLSKPVLAQNHPNEKVFDLHECELLLNSFSYSKLLIETRFKPREVTTWNGPFSETS